MAGAGTIQVAHGSTADICIEDGTLAEAVHLVMWSLGYDITNSKTASNSTGGATVTDTGAVTYKGKMAFLMHDGEVCPMIGGKNYDVKFYVGAKANNNYYTGTIKALGMAPIEVELEDGSKALKYDFDWEGRGVMTTSGTLITNLPTE
jgi:hypothetical protein